MRAPWGLERLTAACPALTIWGGRTRYNCLGALYWVSSWSVLCSCPSPGCLQNAFKGIMFLPTLSRPCRCCLLPGSLSALPQVRGLPLDFACLDRFFPPSFEEGVERSQGSFYTEDTQAFFPQSPASNLLGKKAQPLVMANLSLICASQSSCFENKDNRGVS